MKRAADFPRILLYRGPADMRKQSLGLAKLVEAELPESPFEECLFVFCNRGKDIMKALYFDRAGFCLWVKKLDRGRFPWLSNAGGKSITVPPEDLELLFDGVDVFKRHDKLSFETLS